ncbi:hypothetical protein RB195_009234 [Necator americanus]|uniref:Uncharacterized protein n=1 Tax=Necator americanus TaxID=51031 RepID=A0ABR1CSD3_NECAM
MPKRKTLLGSRHRVPANGVKTTSTSCSALLIENDPRFFGHAMRGPSDCLAQAVLKMLPNPNWKRPPGRKRKFWTEVVKEGLRTLGVDKRFDRDAKFLPLVEQRRMDRFYTNSS